MDGSPKLNVGMQVGDYLLKELISEGSATRTWYADQVSVRREVIVDSLRSAILQNHDVRDAFLADVRAKASVDHPFIGSVFEAVRLEEEDICFYARERLAGETLERISERGEKMTPPQVVKILKQIAEANLYLEKQNIGSIPIGPHQIYIGDKHLTRLVNMAIGERRDHAVSTEDKATIGEIFVEILDNNQPGATRVASLLGFMVDRTREIPITWEQIFELSEQVEKQLREQATAQPPEEHTVSLKDKDLRRNTIVTLAAVGGVVLLAFGSVLLYTGPKKTHARELDQKVSIDIETVKIGKRTVKLKPFEMDAHEVTIAEYAKFLSDIELSGSERFKDPAQPDEVKDFIPHDWENMYNAAKNGEIWDGKTMDVNQPIANVNWWAAKAYANWKTFNGGGEKYDLPSEAQWFAVLDGQDVSSLVAGAWAAVDASTTDVTSTNIYGLAGGVSEWSNATELNIDGSEEYPVALGASSKNPDKGALKRDIVRSKSVVRSDLGFRLIKSK